MDKKNIKFDDTEVEEYEFNQYKSPILINDVDINKIVVSNKFPFGKQDFKYFTGYKDNKEIRPLGIFFPEMSMHERYSDETKCMYFIIKDEKNFDEYMAVWERLSNITKTKFNIEIMYLEKFQDSTQKKAFDVFIYQ